MIHARFHGTGATWDNTQREDTSFGYRPVTFFGASFQTLRLNGP